MEIDQKQHCQLDGESSKELEMPSDQETKEVVPGVPIIRSNTPRPISFEAMMSTESQQGQNSDTATLPPFPAKAPSAPPLPEEMGEREGDEAATNATSISSLTKSRSSTEETQEFLWLFEYGLEMDSTILNSPERLDGLALLYGPAVLKGYAIVLGDVGLYSGSSGNWAIATIVPSSEAEAEVWGVLYRIPRRLLERVGNEPSLLDSVHAATSQGLFKRVQVVVRETYRDREVQCVAYMATEATRQKLYPLSGMHSSSDALFIQHLNTIAKKQKLPESYLSKYMLSGAPVAYPAISRGGEFPPSSPYAEHNTEPLPAWKERTEETQALGSEREELQRPIQNRWLVVFSSYLALVLLLVLAFAVLQGLGFGSSILTAHFMPLGVPWLVLVYGLLGGCISSIITLERSHLINPPIFVIITWFTRPYIGAALALLTYLFLTSGFFMLDSNDNGHRALFLLAGALAGLCEGWIFIRRK
ncbi:gamma-glutamylcyclotransferase [Ktedonosporobacter rubrisoli]|uniref:Gamma-glutamylcyclotransferase n=1 Tax=Ktedonosporobacter rubrisoli TaxID=2509675 RepID=A0A4P6JV39_KTERU|nr:gamma-glutamylcyclotransferase family protein [Ktedonosporobacter rubrisoli]QBD79223.1 gamma-glutamylcyclotransferase [Ktedonosporobacter rubrisoli]